MDAFAGQAPHGNTTFNIKVADETLNYRPATLTDPMPLGRQILQVTGATPVEEFSLFAILPSGDFEDLRLDEPFDLRGRGAEHFVYFRTDRDFKFTIDNKQLVWGKPIISGAVLRGLANFQPGYDLYLEVRGGQDIKVENRDIIDLNKPGIERFITVIAATTEGLTALPTADRTFLEGNGIAYEIVHDGVMAGVVLKAFPLPQGMFDYETADILIQLPAGYPDACPDMFFASPRLRFQDGRMPMNTEVDQVFAGRTWQRWSRHSQEWRAGVDGLRTMVARVRRALEAGR
ncbi:multiubiquitin domain-containing protein [Roseomonas sp. SSH11]|uniref:Multiubiquitin domain-containing protein n=1 Tax=Pararoseomonas baculiformis TaxID=2820812 RepID=A0ABS4AM15_9PROT|nr:multiubiquitin domain-containing protein [Pararoseomonas baculiformis]MBP0447264.1 multiubiquitin domain-containing protein [Pararoseomonas baculiformis]